MNWKFWQRSKSVDGGESGPNADLDYELSLLNSLMERLDLIEAEIDKLKKRTETTRQKVYRDEVNSPANGTPPPPPPDLAAMINALPAGTPLPEGFYQSPQPTQSQTPDIPEELLKQQGGKA